MNVIIEQMSCENDPEMGNGVQLTGIIRTLLDPENMLASPKQSEKTDFLNFFYKHCMGTFIGEWQNLSKQRNSPMDAKLGITRFYFYGCRLDDSVLRN